MIHKPKHYINAVSIYRIYSHRLVKKIYLLSRALELINYIIFNTSIPASSVIGRGTYCSHRGMSVVIHKSARIGKDCVIGTCVTIGGKGKNIEGAPVIGNGVFIATGAKILGDVVIGDNVTIGANSVVISNVANGETVVGIPARVIGNEI